MEERKGGREKGAPPVEEEKETSQGLMRNFRKL
jgi:hypothetical protein